MNKSLKNVIINLSNPYNFNFWRKISNIILKNIFIILRDNKLTIVQNKDNSILKKLEKYLNDKKLELNINNKKYNKYKKGSKNPVLTNIEEKLKIYKNALKPNKTIQNISQAADKERSYNLIVIYNKDKPDIIASLSIDFLFFLKEKGNQINHFDEKELNFLLFNEVIVSY